MVSAIIVSAGKSTRMCGVNKQFLLLENIPVLIHSIKAFDIIDDVSEIIVVTNEDSIDKTNELINNYSFNKNIKITAGSTTRQKSVFCGFDIISPKNKYVAVHDGARPLISKKTVLAAIENAKKYKASAVGVPVKDTIKVIEDGFIVNTPDRNTLYITQTPQIFDVDLYRNGIDNAIKNNLDFTDDCQLVEAIGAKVFMTNGEYKNIKITTPEDIKLAEMLYREN